MLAGRWFNRLQFALGFGFGGTLIFQLCNLTSIFKNNFGCGSRRDEFQIQHSSKPQTLQAILDRYLKIVYGIRHATNGETQTWF
jgi:hypothetical protein